MDAAKAKLSVDPRRYFEGVRTDSVASACLLSVPFPHGAVGAEGTCPQRAD